MKLQGVNFLDGAPATHPRLVDSPHQHNTSSPLGDAASLYPQSSNSATHSPAHLDHANFQQHNTSSPFVSAVALDHCTSDLNMLQPHLDDANYHQHNTLQPHLDHAYVQTHNTSSPLRGAACLEPHASSWATPQSHLNQANFQHHASNPFGGATALDHYTSHLHSPQNLVMEAQQAGFTEAPHPPPSTQEKLNDVTTWGIDKIREVAMHFCKNPEVLAVFDLQDPTNSNNGSDDDEEEMGMYGGVNLEHDPRQVDPAGTSHAPPPSGGAGSRGRRLRVHEWGPQSDPEKEKRRKDAVRQWQQRKKEKDGFKQLEKDLQNQRKVVKALRREASYLQQVLQRHEHKEAQQGCLNLLLKLS
ncbi:uncharacterized protein LOC126998422 [Eriocheir sinensis]|uniref:uncharacterized protein LOC126998422 n=1 Tax=Eriocheir sinensis TaxID=95602 RepID=UPI0021C886F0|nr:uncharacterized protein LOC126998422 [Eriocheir sinensis]